MKIQFGSLTYRVVLKFFCLGQTYRGTKRFKIGESPYPRRNPFLLTLLNLQQLVAYFKTPRMSRHQKLRIQSLKDSQIGKVVLILGNGPSLNRLDPVKVNSDSPDVWVLNDFYKVDIARKLKISHYTLSDKAHLEDINLGGNFRFDSILEYVINQSSKLVVPHWAEEHLLEIGFPSEKILLFNDRDLSAWTRNIFPDKPRGYLGLTLYKSLAYALYLGYSEINILGMDNSEFLGLKSNLSNSILLFGNHAYATSDSAHDLSHRFMDGFAGAFTMYSHTFGDLAKFTGPIINLDKHSLTTQFKKIENHKWLRPDIQ